MVENFKSVVYTHVRNVPEHLCGGYVYLGRCIKCSTFYLLTKLCQI